jgi:hypothetical protein
MNVIAYYLLLSNKYVKCEGQNIAHHTSLKRLSNILKSTLPPFN